MSHLLCRCIKLCFVGFTLVLAIMNRPLLAQEQSMFDGFWTYCVEQAIVETPIPRTNLYEFSEDEIVRLSDSLDWSDVPEAVWAPSDGSWFIIDMKTEDTQQCTVASINEPLDQNVIEWNEKIGRDASFRSKDGASARSRRSGGFATKSVDSGFVQIALSNLLLNENPLASLSLLTVIRVGQTPASCELFPLKCS